MKIISKEHLKKPVIPAKAGIQGLKNRGKSNADWMLPLVALVPSSANTKPLQARTPALLQSMKQCALICGRLSSLSFSGLVLLVSAVLPMAAIAAEAPTKIEAKSLGRLFYTPEQRLQIDRMKNRPGQTGMTLGNTISINGIVQRRGGGSGDGSVVWINGVAQSRESADGLLAGRDIAPDAASVKVPGASKVVRLKVGQTLDLNSGAVRNISVAPVAGKGTPTEKERARAAEQADSSTPQPAQASKDKAVSPYGKTE